MLIIGVVLALILWVILLIYEGKKEPITAEIFCCSLVAFILLGLVVGVFFTLPFIETAEMGPKVPDGEPYSIELVALKDNKAVNGNFFLGTGTIDEDQYYFYLTKTEKGIQQRKLENTSDVYLNYTENGDTPRIMVQKCRCADPVINFLALDPTFTEYYIYVPEGSITNEFSVDLE